MVRKLLGGLGLGKFVLVGLGCAHVWCCVCVFPICWPWTWSSVAWVSGLDWFLGLAGQSCGLKKLGCVPLADFVVVGAGCVHALVCVCCSLCGCMV